MIGQGTGCIWHVRAVDAPMHLIHQIYLATVLEVFHAASFGGVNSNVVTPYSTELSFFGGVPLTHTHAHRDTKIMQADPPLMLT